MRNALPVVASIALIFAGCTAARAGDPNELTSEERAAGFQLLSNGEDFTGWRQQVNWVIEDGAMYREERGGSIVYKERVIPDDFALTFEWKVGEGSNSGLYYRPRQVQIQRRAAAGHRHQADWAEGTRGRVHV